MFRPLNGSMSSTGGLNRSLPIARCRSCDSLAARRRTAGVTSVTGFIVCPPQVISPEPNSRGDEDVSPQGALNPIIGPMLQRNGTGPQGLFRVLAVRKRRRDAAH